jgi:predicted RNA binding protein YcfA (HicA-like mRNA interferase family)
MSKLPVISGRQLVKALCNAGFQLERQKGSHMMLYRAHPPTTLSVPDHRELDRGTLRSLLRIAGVNPDELSRLL